jgi:hypothetical protein
MHIPLPINDETLYGVLARGMYINGFWKHLSGMEKLTGHKVTSLANLKANALLLSDYVIGLGSEQIFGVSLLEQQLGGEQHQDHDLISYASGKFVNGVWKSCRLCLEEDTGQFGTGTWHLSHQLPTTLLCPFHHEPLSTHSLKRKMLHDRFYLPMQANSSPLRMHADLKNHLESLANLGHEALMDRSEPYPTAVIEQVFKRAMFERGLLNGDCLSKRAHEDFSEFFGSTTVADSMGINLSRLLNGILKNDEVPVIQRILLVYWWFGSWQLFKSLCHWQQIFCDQKTATQESNFQDLRKLYRERCLRYIETVEGADRSMLLRNEYKVFRWLRANDRKWFDKQLPMVKQIQYSLFR